MIDRPEPVEAPDNPFYRDDIDRHLILTDREDMGDTPMLAREFGQRFNTGFEIEKFFSRDGSVSIARKETNAPPANPGHATSRQLGGTLQRRRQVTSNDEFVSTAFGRSTIESPRSDTATSRHVVGVFREKS